MSEVKKNIGIFTFDDASTTMEYGYYYKASFKVPFDSEERMVRVWLPEDYDFDNPDVRFPVIYMSDGQNLVNKNLTAFGDWHFDKVCHKLKEEYNVSIIAVGVDSPRDDVKRSDELNPPFIPNRAKKMHPVGDVFVDFLADSLKPIIDETFHTKKEKEYTAVGGSSMGGIMAFYGGVRRYDVFGFSLDFSPAFLLYYKRRWEELLNSFKISKENKTRFYFYVGGKGFERYFRKLTFFTYEYLLKLGFSENEVAFVYDKKMIHHEDAWSYYLGSAILFWLENE